MCTKHDISADRDRTVVFGPGTRRRCLPTPRKQLPLELAYQYNHLPSATSTPQLRSVDTMVDTTQTTRTKRVLGSPRRCVQQVGLASKLRTSEGSSRSETRHTKTVRPSLVSTASTARTESFAAAPLPFALDAPHALGETPPPPEEPTTRPVTAASPFLPSTPTDRDSAAFSRVPVTAEDAPCSSMRSPAAAAAAVGLDRASVGEEDGGDFVLFADGEAGADPEPVPRIVPRTVPRTVPRPCSFSGSEKKRKRACAGRPVVPCPACGSREAVLCTRSSFPWADQHICGWKVRFCHASRVGVYCTKKRLKEHIAAKVEI